MRTAENRSNAVDKQLLQAATPRGGLLWSLVAPKISQMCAGEPSRQAQEDIDYRSKGSNPKVIC